MKVWANTSRRSMLLDYETESSGVQSPVSPTSLPKPSPPSPEGMKTPPKKADNIYAQVYGNLSGGSSLTDDTLPLGSPWATPGLRRADPEMVREFMERHGQPAEPDEEPTVSPVQADLIGWESEHDGCEEECSESSSPDDDSVLAP